MNAFQSPKARTMQNRMRWLHTFAVATAHDHTRHFCLIRFTARNAWIELLEVANTAKLMVPLLIQACVKSDVWFWHADVLLADLLVIENTLKLLRAPLGASLGSSPLDSRFALAYTTMHVTCHRSQSRCVRSKCYKMNIVVVNVLLQNMWCFMGKNDKQWILNFKNTEPWIHFLQRILSFEI